MNFRLFNYVRGGASLLNCWAPRDFNAAVRAEMDLAAWRAEEECLAPAEALQKGFRERMMGQFIFTTLALGLMALTLVLARKDSAPEWALCILAVTPSVMLMSAVWLERRIRRNWNI